MSSVLFSVENQIGTVYLNEPDKLNAFIPSIKREVIEVLTEISDREDIKAVVIAGKGKSFCAGGDLKSLANLKIPNEIEENMRYTVSIIKKIFNLNKPVISCVHGYAAGAGFSLALASDLIIAEANAKFKLAFKNVGLIPDLGLHYFLSRAVGPWKAKELIWRGVTITAKEASNLGIVNEVVGDGTGYERALEIANELVIGPSLAFAKTKELINHYGQNSLEEVLTVENFSQTILRTTDDNSEGIEAFYQKRKPTFTGK